MRKIAIESAPGDGAESDERAVINERFEGQQNQRQLQNNWVVSVIGICSAIHFWASGVFVGYSVVSLH